MPNALPAESDRRPTLRYPLRVQLHASMHSATLRGGWRDFRETFGLSTLKALGGAAVFGLTYYVAHQAVGVTIASGVLFAVIAAFLSFVGLLVLAAGKLELRL